MLEVTLNWKNPVESIEGDAFTSEQTVQQVYIYRDDFETPAFTLEGAIETAVDNEESGLTAGAHNYKIKVVVADKESDFSNEASVLYVGPMATQNLPWNPTVTGMSTEDFHLMWTAFNNVPGQFSTWSNRPAGILFMNSSNATADCWLIGNAPLDIDAEKSYEINYHFATNASGFTPDVEIGFVDSLSPSEFVDAGKVEFGSDSKLTLSIKDSETNMLSRAAQNYYIAVHDATVDPTSGYNLTLSSLGVKEDTTTGISEIAAGSVANGSIYDLSGKKVSDSIERLPKGIYIIMTSDGKASKVVK